MIFTNGDNSLVWEFGTQYDLPGPTKDNPARVAVWRQKNSFGVQNSTQTSKYDPGDYVLVDQQGNITGVVASDWGNLLASANPPVKAAGKGGEANPLTDTSPDPEGSPNPNPAPAPAFGIPGVTGRSPSTARRAPGCRTVVT